jgi:imidazolonepropionase-like amidohydrolase
MLRARWLKSASWLACVGSATSPVHADLAAIRNVAIVDVEAGAVRVKQTIVVNGEKIAKVAPREAITVFDGANVINGENLYALPGLFDSHVHYISPETFGPLCIAHGVTFVRDLGGATEMILHVRDQLNSGKLLGPEMIAAGAIVDGVPPIWPFSEPVDDPEAARQAVRKLADRGVDFIKVYSMLKKDVHRAAVEEAHSRGLKAVGHVPLSMTLTDALDVGQDGIEHLEGFDVHIAEAAGEPITQWPRSYRDVFDRWDRYARADHTKLRELYARVARQGVAVCPTIVVMKSIGLAADPNREDKWMDHVPAYLRGFWNSERTRRMAPGAARSVQPMQEAVAALHKAGVLLLCGTDLANPNVIAGHSLLEEMELWQEAGVPAADALRGATVRPAKFFGVADRLGTISEGKTASLVLVRGNPLEDVRNARQIEGVFLKGRYFDRKALDELLADVRRTVKADTPVKASASPDAQDDWGMPGEMIRKGRYRSTFQGMDAGTEEFAISRTAEGYVIKAKSRPTGGVTPPSDVMVTTDHNYVLVSATWRTLTDTPVEAVYTRAGDKITAEAKQGDTHHPKTEVGLPADGIFGGPATGMQVMGFKQVKLGIGQSRSYHSVGFGLPSWELDATPVQIERLPDEALALSADQPVATQVFFSVFPTPMGVFSGKSWIDGDGVVVKSTLKMPFGTVETTLESTATAPR